MNVALNTADYKKCPMCGHIWHNRIELLDDPKVSLLGYQVNYKQLELGLFLFNHLECGGTFALQAKQFMDLYDGPIFNTRLTGTQECPGYCQHEENLQACSAACECAYIRDVIQIIKNWQTSSALIINGKYDV